MSERKRNYWPDSVDRKIRLLKKGDHISVLWIDAAQTSNVMTRPILGNHQVETRRQTQGTFYGIQAGQTYHDLFLLIARNFIDDDRMTVDSIPLCLIKEIDVFNKREMATVNRNRTIRYPDGSIKRIGYRGT